MRNLGLGRLLQTVVILPLVVLAAFGSVLVLEALSAYRAVERLSALEQLVSAASQLTTVALDHESDANLDFAATGSANARAEMLSARARADQAIAAFRSAAASAPLTDSTATGLISDIERRLGALAGYRTKADARTLQRADSAALLQPMTAGLADLIERIAVLVDQSELSRLLLGRGPSSR
jgi:hypothetical protein